MLQSLAHRGPDAEGFFSDPEQQIHLGHRRLSIIDLSTAANHPFHSNSGNSVIVFNGEIYNFRELRSKYQLHTRTQGDTEVLVELYEKLGASFVKELNGIFAFALWDRKKQELMMARDHMGIKPLFYYHENGELAFASELKAFDHHQTFRKDRRIDKQAIFQYLNLGYIPAPNTAFEQIRKFPQGHYAIASGKSLEFTPYWRLTDYAHHRSEMNYGAAKEELHTLLWKSVERQMISDVPIGTFLSGGIDSSTVTALASRISKERVKTFSIGFKEAKFNEAVHAEAVAHYLKTEHYEFMVSEQDALDLFNDISSTYDEPYADSSAIPTMLVSQLARKHVTVTLSGDGGDEQFMGYGMYAWAGRLQNPFFKANRKWIAALLRKGNPRMQRAAMVFDYKDTARLQSHIFSQEQYYFSVPEIRDLLLPDWQSNLYIQEFDESAHERLFLSAEELQALFDMKYYLPDELLVKVDRASMKYSLETRVPLLDHQLIQFSLQLPQEFKIKNGISKFILKDILYHYLPQELFERPKWGFSIPLSRWLKNEWADMLEHYSSKEMTLRCGMLDYDKLLQLKKDYLNGKDYLYNRLWQIILLHRWMDLLLKSDLSNENAKQLVYAG